MNIKLSIFCVLLALALFVMVCTKAYSMAKGQEETETSSQQKIYLWKGTKVNAPSVTLTAYVPKKNDKGIAVIVCPGGSYCWLDCNVEGKMVAEWLNNNGITAFVLNYRVQGKFQYVTHSRIVFGGHHHPDMITDLQRAIQYVRDNSAKYNIKYVGTMGFSAGGHLAMCGAEFCNTDFLESVGVNTDVSLRPDFVASIYPVVSMSEKCTHKRSRRALLGEHGKKDMILRDSLSLEKNVPKDCPPVFLVNCRDDHTVNFRNSELLDSALTAQGVNHKYIQYNTGGHGFGASDIKGTAECREWKPEFINWLQTILNY